MLNSYSSSHHRTKAVSRESANSICDPSNYSSSNCIILQANHCCCQSDRFMTSCKNSLGPSWVVAWLQAMFVRACVPHSCKCSKAAAANLFASLHSRRSACFFAGRLLLCCRSGQQCCLHIDSNCMQVLAEKGTAWCSMVQHDVLYTQHSKTQCSITRDTR